jgi:hypothetical protein
VSVDKEQVSKFILYQKDSDSSNAMKKITRQSKCQYKLPSFWIEIEPIPQKNSSRIGTQFQVLSLPTKQGIKN